MQFTTIRKPSAPEMVAEQILAKIHSGELIPGGRLPAQRDLATMLGVGRSSVREAINALVVAGVLEAVHGRGTFVARDSRSDAGLLKLKAALGAGSLLELMEARELLECKTAALAAERADEGLERACRTGSPAGGNRRRVDEDAVGGDDPDGEARFRWQRQV